jgi:hypothetical protein
MKGIAFIKPDGQIERMQLSTGLNMPEGYGDEPDVSEGLYVKYVYESLDNMGKFMETHIYDFDTDTFILREARPNPAAQWINGAWSWTEAAFADFVRLERDRRLYISDWTQLPDNTLTETQKTEALQYRQSLRDITSNLTGISKLEDVVWPIVPSFIRNDS